MRKSWVGWLLATCLWPGSAGAEDRLVIDTAMEVLDNGLTVIVEEDQRTDTVVLHLAYGVGSRDEVDGEHGCAHLFEHLMFEGSENVPTNAFDDWLTAAGGDNNAYTSADETAYHMAFPSGALDLALFLESDRMAFLEAGLDEKNLANQRLVVLQERNQGYAEPHGTDWDALTRLLYPVQHPYMVPVIGTVADVEGFQIDAVRDFWRRHYRPRNAVLVLVGNLETDVALERVRHWFSDVPDAGPPMDRPVVPPGLPVLARNGVIEDRVEDRTLYAAWRTVPSTHADAPALDLLAWALSGGRGTRLDDKLYYRSRLTNEVGADHYGQDIDGEFVLWASSERVPLKKLLKVSQKVIDDVQKNPITEAELDRARRMLEAMVLDSLEPLRSRARMIANCHTSWGWQDDCLETDWFRYQLVTVDDLARVADEYLVAERRVTLSVVPEGDDGAIDGAAIVEVP